MHNRNIKRQSKRRLSSIIGMRMYHNWVKRRILTEAKEYLEKSYDKRRVSLLDLAVGRGGDMNKWIALGINRVIGIDIDRRSIEEAERRHRKLRKGNYKFYVYDLSDPENIAKIDKIIKNEKFDIVSCQFAIHYMFRDERSLDTFMRIVKRYMAKKGIFIGTTLDGKRIDTLLGEADIVKKKLYYIENKERTETAYGNKYVISIGQTGKKESHYFAKAPSVEYKVDIDELKRVAEKYGLRYVGAIEFKTWYEKYVERNTKYKMSEEEKEFSYLNFSFVFVNI